MSTTYIGGHGPDAQECCLCCGECYCNCCACSYEGTLDFEMIECSWINPMNPTVVHECMCDDWSFTMEHKPDMCYVHTSGGGCSPCYDEYQGHCFTESCLPFNPDYTEAWGWSGVVCDSCTTNSPPTNSSSCAGMGIKASLCCCKTGIPMDSDDPRRGEHPCPHPNFIPPNCQSTPPSVASGNPLCSLDCFWFEITPEYTYYINGGSEPDSPCSSCAAFPMGGGGGGGNIVGTLQDRICMIPVSGQCACTTCDPQKKFMLTVSGDFSISCDCQTGIYQSFGGGGGSVTPVTMTVIGLISES